ncbi:ComEA family DNA-binding protein [Shewanella sp. A3A]|nr:ComEA family DNA-binding protein [Shewanella ferrihydritica]
MISSTIKRGLFTVALLLLPFATNTYAKDEMPQASVQQLQKVNINTASADELQLLKGVGEEKAKAIVDYRNSNGKFESIEQLKQVKGIGDKIIESNSDSLTL